MTISGRYHTQTYLGTLGLGVRRVPDIYSFDLAALTER